VELELHPLLKQLQILVGRSDENVSSKLEQVMKYTAFAWAAMYIITDAGQMVFKVKKEKRQARMEAFGGGMPSGANIVFAIAKLRSELADESSIRLSDVNCVRMSPLILVKDGLVQIAMIKQEWLDKQMLWVPEAARGWWHWQKKQRDDITGFHEELDGPRGDDLRKELEVKSDWKIDSMNLDDVLQCVKETSHYQWRNADLDSLQKIMPIIRVMTQTSWPGMLGHDANLHGQVFDCSLPIQDSSAMWCNAPCEFAELLCCEELEPLWELAKKPWPQILKYHSEILLQFSYLRFALCRPHMSPQQILDTHGECLQGGLAKLWRVAACDPNASARHIKRQEEMWPKIYPDGHNDARHKIESEWFEPRGLCRYLTFHSIKNMDGDQGGVKGGNLEGGNWDFADLVDLGNLFNSAEIYKNTRRIKETNHRGTLCPCGAQLKAAPMVSLFLLAFLYISAELNKLTKYTKSTKSQLPPSQLPPLLSLPKVRS